MAEHDPALIQDRAALLTIIRGTAALYALLGALFLALALLAGCAIGAPEIVKIPVPVRAAPPTELLRPIDVSRLPVFISPADPRATSGLAGDGERRLKQLLQDLLARVRAWEAWGNDDPNNGAPPQ